MACFFVFPYSDLFGFRTEAHMTIALSKPNSILSEDRATILAKEAKEYYQHYNDDVPCYREVADFILYGVGWLRYSLEAVVKLQPWENVKELAAQSPLLKEDGYDPDMIDQLLESEEISAEKLAEYAMNTVANALWGITYCCPVHFSA